MMVETFELQEVDEQTIEQSQECAELASQLGLEGQVKFYQKAEDGGVAVFPYRKMTAQEKLVISTVLSAETELSEYKDGPIPLRVLQVAVHVKALTADSEEEIYLCVWHSANADYKDPYLVMRRGPKYGKHEWFILARWGEALDNFSIFVEKAREILKAKRCEKLEGIRAEVDSAISAIDSAVHTMLLTGNHRDVSFYNH